MPPHFVLYVQPNPTPQSTLTTPNPKTNLTPTPPPLSLPFPAGLFKVEPLVTAGSPPSLNPVNFVTFVNTGAISFAILSSYLAWHDKGLLPLRLSLQLFAAFIVLTTTYFFVMLAVTRVMGFGSIFYFVDVLLMILLYVMWQLGCGFVGGSVPPRYPRVKQAVQLVEATTHKMDAAAAAAADGDDDDDDDTKKKARSKISFWNNFLFSTLIPLILLLFYSFILIPSFSSCSPMAQFVIRIIGHTLIKSQASTRQRDGFATAEFAESVKSMSVNMFAMSAVWSIAGRFLLTALAVSGKSTKPWYVAAVVLSSYLEWFQNVNAESIGYFFRVYLLHVPPLQGQALLNYRIAEASQQAQGDAIEIAGIIITGGVFLALYGQRHAVGLGFKGGPPNATKLLLGAGLQLACELPTDILITGQLLEDGLLVDEYYKDCFEDGVVTKHTLWTKLTESSGLLFAMFTVLVIFRVAPIPGFCASADICSCSFYSEVVVNLCNNTAL